MLSFSVVMPVYNEAQALADGVRCVAAYFDKLRIPFELIIVESGSTDGTGERADELAKERPEVSVVHEGRRNGFGSGVQLGYQRAAMQWVWLITPDLPFPLESLEEAIPLLDSYGAVLSYRVGDERSGYRRFQSFCFNLLVRLLFGLKVRCVNSAFKILPAELVRNLKLKSLGWTIDAEVIYILQQRGVRYAELGVPICDRVVGTSKISVRTAWRVVKELWDLWRCRRQLGSSRLRLPQAVTAAGTAAVGKKQAVDVRGSSS